MNMINNLREITTRIRRIFFFEFGIIFKKSVDENEIYVYLSKTFRKM
jgi:hypothetical protein